MKRFLPLVLVVAAIGCSSGGVEVGNIAPEIKAETLADGKPVTLAQFRGKVVVLDFWATWCGPCVEAMPHLVAAQAKYGDKLKILAISNEDRETITKFRTATKIDLEYVRDPFQTTQESYNVTGFPTTYVIGKDGKIAWSSVGFDEVGLNQALEAATK